MPDKLTIVKVGGAIVEEPLSLSKLLNTFAQIGGRRILIHGGDVPPPRWPLPWA